MAAIYSSPLERAIETARALGEPHGLEPRIEDAFGEVRMGEWEGMEIAALEGRADWRRFNEFRSGTRVPGGESMIEVQARMVRQLECVAVAHPEATVAVVSHGDPLRSLLAYFLGIPLDLMQRFEIEPASVSVLEVAEWGARVRVVNRTVEV